MAIVIEKLSYTYLSGSSLSNSALRNISLTVEPGEFLGIIGHTGSGKSTLVQHMNGLLQGESGRVLVDGLDMADKKQRVEGRKRVGVVFQYPEYQLFEETVARDVAYGPKNMGLSEEEVAVRVDAALRRVGLMPEVFAEKSPFELSGGEKRRAALAGTIAMEPQYMVLDEPMAGLDPRGRREIMDLLEELRADAGCAIVMVSHSMDDMARYARRIVVLNQGELVRDGTAEAVFGEVAFLTSIGLDVPQIAMLAAALRQRGMEVPSDVIDMRGMVRFLRRCEHV